MLEVDHVFSLLSPSQQNGTAYLASLSISILEGVTNIDIGDGPCHPKVPLCEFFVSLFVNAGKEDYGLRCELSKESVGVLDEYPTLHADGLEVDVIATQCPCFCS